MILTDQTLTNPRIWELVQKENQRQLAKWGIQSHSPFEWLTYTTEELGELAQAISEHYYNGAPIQDVIAEAIQTATLSLKIAEMYISKENENATS